jgi:hypothetical protein
MSLRITSLGQRLLAVFALGFTLLGGLAQAAEPASVAERITSIRGITYYTYGTEWEHFDLPQFELALNDLKQLGVNSVWLILPWKSFQPGALPTPTWNEEALKRLDLAVGMIEQHGMNAILPLCYLGPGWEPQGIDARVWTLDDRMYKAFTEYAFTFIGRLASHKNILYLLYTEGCEPYIDTVRNYPIAVEAFRAWCKSVNPKLEYWNQRWDTKFANWEAVLPIGYTSGDANPARFDDHWRWCASILRERHAPLAREIRKKIKGQALLGYHDYSLIAQDWARGESPITADIPYDFLSIAGYYGLANASFEQYKTSIVEIVARCRTRYPQLPFAMLETGATTYEVGFQGQADAMNYILEMSRKQHFGVNFWMYKDFQCPDLSQAAFGLYTPQGKPKPSLDAVKQAWAPFAPKPAPAK